jgi:hypothetical protein
MSWIKLDDHFADHPKIAVAGPLAAWLHVKALVYCGRYLTDGKIPFAIVVSLVDWATDGVMIETSNFSADTPTNTGLAARLCEAGLWHEVEGGFEIHDYLEWNPSRSEVLADRERQKAAKVKAGQAGAAKRWQRDSRPIADGWQGDSRGHGKAMAENSPVPVPVPVPNKISTHTVKSGENLEGYRPAADRPAGPAVLGRVGGGS